MRRADRLFAIVQTLRGRRLTTAAHLAERLQVSLRTIYRDIADLSRSGVPVEGEAGVGYRLRPGFELPPLMFDLEEIEALVAGARIVQAWSSPALAAGAERALEKIAAALPPSRRDLLEQTRLFALKFAPPPDDRIDPIRAAIAARNIMMLDYRDAVGAASQRRVWALGLWFWGTSWTLGAWCEHRSAFRNFRLDRIAALHKLDETFPDQAGRRLADFIRVMRDS